jgi:MtN3 and saliva related transmembrane protein
MTWTLIDYVGVTGAALTTLGWLPQTVKTVRSRDTRAISLPFTAMMASGVVLWLIYGLALGDVPLIGSNSVSLTLVLTILAMKLRYG